MEVSRRDWAYSLFDPDCRHVRQERIPPFSGNSRNVKLRFAVGVQDAAGSQNSPGNGNLLEQDRVGVLGDVLVESNVDAGKGHPEVEIQGAPYLRGFPVQETHVEVRLQGSGYVDQQGRTQGDFLFARQLRFHLGLGACFRRYGCKNRRDLAFRVLFLLLFGSPEQQKPGAGGCRGQGKKSEHGETGNQAERHHERARDKQGPWLGAELPADVAGQVFRLVGADPGDDDSRRHGDQQSGNLRHQPVSDSKDRVDLNGLVEVQAALRHADDQPADKVYADDDQSGDGVPLDELHGAVHRAVELTLLLDHLSPPARLGHVDHTGAHVPVYAHLLAGHRIEGKACAHLGHTLRALGYHQELDDGDDQEDHHADHEVAGDDEVAERVNDGAGIGLQQHEPGRGDGQGQAEQGRQQQNRGEREEIAGRADVDGEHQQHDGYPHAHADEHVHQLGGQGQDHHEDDGHQERCEQYVLALRNAVENGSGLFLERASFVAFVVSGCRSGP